MQAVIYTEYGPPDVLKVAEVSQPEPEVNDVLVRVRASSVTTGDCNMRNFVFVPAGFGLPSRMAFGIRKPRKQVLGIEFAGEVVAVGADVTTFKAGDAVFGIDSARLGAYAEYKIVSADAGIVHKPATLSYEEAASIPNGALTALTFLRKFGNIQAGESVLVNGASGSVGSAAVQLAKYFGATVTGVCSGRNADLVRSLGADDVIDYTQEDFTQGGERYDIILDAVGKAPFMRSKHALKAGGRYLSVAGGLREFGQMARTALFGNRKVLAGVSSESQADLQFIAQLIEDGHLKPVVDRCYPLDAIVEAHRYVDTGRKRGNVVITVAE